jgi:hypothetical protein
MDVLMPEPIYLFKPGAVMSGRRQSSGPVGLAEDRSLPAM